MAGIYIGGGGHTCVNMLQGRISTKLPLALLRVLKRH